MKSKFFWNKWPKPYRQLLWVLISLTLVIMSWFGFLYLSGTEAIIGWDILAKTEYVDVVIDSFKIGPFNISTSAENPIFFQQYSGSMPAVNTTSSYALLIFTVLALNILITVTTTLPRFWYFAGIAIFAFLLTNFKLEVLLLFGSSKKWGLIIALASYFTVSFYFNSIKPHISLLTRLAFFLTITGVLGVIIAFFAETQTPFLFMAAHGVINSWIIGIIFILTVAHEIIAAFIYLLTSSQGTSVKKTNTITHFYVITGIYLLNLLLAYLYETNVINWDLIYIDLFLLIGISAILGFWGFAQREEQYKFLFGFYPIGALVFLTMAGCCFLTLAHFTATFNDPAIEVFRDFIINAHLGYGLMFVVYVTSNFMDPLRRNMPVSKILYKPMTMPYFTFRLAGLIAVTALILKSNWEVPVNQSAAAYFNGIADVHYHNGEMELAETYYEEGAVFGYRNHKSHYMLAKLALMDNDDVKAAVHFRTATQKNPTAQSFVNLSNIYMDQSRFFDALFALNKGLEQGHVNGAINNNLGLAYSQTDILDTAVHYLNNAFKNSKSRTPAASNMIALLAKKDINVDPDSVLKYFDAPEDRIYTNNSFVLKSEAGEHLQKHFTPDDSLLSMLEASIVYNEAFNHLFGKDSLDTSRLDRLSGYAGNINFRENLTFVACLNHYRSQNINLAFRKLNWLAGNSTFNSGEYFNLIGLWALQQGAPAVAAEYFRWAKGRNWNDAHLNYAIALTENRQIEEAIKAWTALLNQGDNEVRKMAENILIILRSSRQDYERFQDQQKYLYLRYRTGYQDTSSFNVLVKSITNDNYRARALFNMSEKLWKKDLQDEAIGYYGRLAGLKITDQKFYEKIRWYETKMLAGQKNIRGLATKINEGVEFDLQHIIEKHYFTALINQASGDTTSARRHFAFVAYRNPFNEEATVAAADFIGQTDRFEAYKILVNAIEINPWSVKLLKAYILQAARIQRNNYAEISLTDLKGLIPEEAFEQFSKKYRAVTSAVARKEENFWK